MNSQQIMDWVKSNVIILVFVLVMLAAPIVMWFVAGGMNKNVQAEVNNRALKLSQMNVTVSIPSGDVTPTEKLLQDYERVTKTLADDAAAVQKRALEFNRKGRNVLMPNVFPEPPFEMRETIPKRYHEGLVSAYDKLLSDVRAGSPPTLASLEEQLQGMRNRFISQDLKKDPAAALEPEEDARLKKMLSEARMGMYKQAASSVGLYADAEALFIPGWNQSRIPSSGEMFNWQWQLWAVDDVMRSFAAVNKDAGSVADAPVKRVLGIVVAGLPDAGESDGGLSAPSQPRLSGGFGEGSSDAPPSDAPADAGAAGAGGMGMANPKAPIARDFSGSLAGLIANPLFDVLTIDFAIVVDTARLPEVLDAVSRYNFNTITNLRVESADSFAATEQGFYYGNQPVSQVTVRMETVWLREWTKQFMPPATRTSLKIPPDAPAVPTADPAVPTAG